MKLKFALVLALFAAASPAFAETRCGWIVNPTPANWWLNDADGEWVIGTQGGDFAEGMDEMPDFTAGDWIVTNGASYGYGCACLNVTTSRKGGMQRITRIKSVRQLPTAKCEADPKLATPDQ